MLSGVGYRVAMRLKHGNIVRHWEDGASEAIGAGLATVNERGRLVPTAAGLAFRRAARRV